MIALGQDAVIRGRVIDQSSMQPLPGATIQFENTYNGVVSDLNGEFQLRVPQGESKLVIKYLGFEEAELTVNPSENKSYEIQMGTNEAVLDEVTIYGQLEGQQKALNQQKNAANIKNIVAADQISRFPDPNVAESMQRLPGTTLSRDQGEGRYIQIRGLAYQFTNVNINGEQIPSPETGVRYVALDAIPSDQLASIEVSKTLTPDMDGDAVGGSVNLITRKAKDSDLQFQGTVLGGYNELMGEPNAQGSFTVGKRLGADEKLGIIVGASHYFTDRGSDNWERDGDEIELRDYELERTRSGVNATIDYRFDVNNEIYFRSIYNSFTDHEIRRRYVFIPDEEFGEPANEIERLTKDRFERQDISSFNLGGKHLLPGFTVDYEVAFSEALQDTPYDYEVNFIAEPDELTTGFSNPDFPTFSTNSDFDYLDNSNYEFDELETGNTYAEEQNRTAKINLTVPYQLGGNSGNIKFGSKYRAKEKRFEVVNNKFEWAGDEISFDGQEGDFTAEKFEGGLLDDDFLDGRYELSRAPDMDRVISFFNSNRNGFELNTEDKLVDESVESYDVTEDVLAFYAMTDLQINKLQIVAGARYERTEVEYNYNTVIFDDEGDLDVIVPESGSSSYDFFLPQVNFRYALSNLTNLRAAVTASYARPNFESIIPSQEINIQDREATIGNPLLEPVSAVNLDLMVDHYFGTVGVLSGGVFYKSLDNFIYTRRFESDTYEGRDFGTDVEFFQEINGEGANVYGVEIAYQQNLTFLPGSLAGLGIYANYTYTASDATLQGRSGVGETETIDLPGQAPSVGNFSLAYNLGGFTTRVSANYHGSYIDELGEDADADEYVKERLQIDWTANYRINDKFNVFAEFININDAPFEAFAGDEDNIIQREFYSWWSRVGVKVNF